MWEKFSPDMWANIIATGSLIVAIVAVVYAFMANRNAARANSLAKEANEHSNTANLIAGTANKISLQTEARATEQNPVIIEGSLEVREKTVYLHLINIATGTALNLTGIAYINGEFCPVEALRVGPNGLVIVETTLGYMRYEKIRESVQTPEADVRVRLLNADGRNEMEVSWELFWSTPLGKIEKDSHSEKLPLRISLDN